MPINVKTFGVMECSFHHQRFIGSQSPLEVSPCRDKLRFTGALELKNLLKIL